jgi:hypothetical protein
MLGLNLNFYRRWTAGYAAGILGYIDGGLPAAGQYRYQKAKDQPEAHSVSFVEARQTPGFRRSFSISEVSAFVSPKALLPLEGVIRA